jgi:competence protein CoiA
MQIYARNSQGTYLHAKEAKKQTDYYCVECEHIIRLRGGPHRQAHFYHLDPTPFCRQHQKGIIHLHLQAYFLKHLHRNDCRIEYHFPSINRIADVAWLSKKLIFEIQYSPISASEVAERNRDYASCGWTVIWILHDHRFNQVRLTSAEIALKSHPHYFSNMDHLGRGILYDQFDYCEDGLRKSRLPPLPIDFRSFFEPPQGSFFSLMLLKQRAVHWPIAFQGDLLSQFIQNSSSEYLQKSQEIEASFQSLSKQKNKNWIGNFWKHPISKLYKIFFRYLLERSCR